MANIGFPAQRKRRLLLPIKAQVRRDEALVPGETVAAMMTLEK
ncbi:hypothetical protein [Sphingobium sp. CR28]